MSGAKAEYTKLLFAVLDGEEPQAWAVFGKTFPALMAQAKQGATLDAVSTDLREAFSVEVEPMLTSPAQLLEDDHLDKVVGVIIDASPNGAAPEQFFDEKLTTLKRLFRKQVRGADKSEEKPVFVRFGYKVWFVAQDPGSPHVAKFVQSVLDFLGRRVGAATVKHEFIVQEAILTYVVNQCLVEAYYTLGLGALD